MNSNTQYSQKISTFHGRKLPNKGVVAGYAAIIEVLALPVPIPNTIAVISEKYRRYEVAGWQVFTPKYQPDKTLYKQLVFALKYEGVNLLLFKKLFEKLSLKEVMHLLQIEPTGQYSRKIWFLYEWLMKQNLDLPDLSIKKAVPLIDEKLQYAISGTSSPRHRIINNLAGTPDFCPLIQRTEKLDKYIESNFTEQKNTYLKDIHKDILQRASAFLLLKDSKASFNIEGESPKSKRATRWGQAIGQAGAKPMSKEELLRLQQLVIQNSRFTTMGFRTDGGFVGEHDRTSGEPIPDHISARWQDAVELTEGLVNVGEKLQKTKMNAVLVASMMAFGFVFIHPFVDGNGRLHRYLIHHILATMGFSQQGIIFPVSASILDHMDDYRKVLESYSIPLLDFIEWKSTKDNNVEILNETIDYYRYYDVTAQTEFLYDCVHDAITNIIPKEVNYLKQYDSFKRFLDDEFEMPDKLVALIVRFLEQNNGKFSKRAEEKELTKLTAKEAKIIEQQFQDIFSSNLP